MPMSRLGGGATSSLDSMRDAEHSDGQRKEKEAQCSHVRLRAAGDV